MDAIFWHNSVASRVRDWEPLCIQLDVRRTAKEWDVFGTLSMRGRLDTASFSVLLTEKRDILESGIRDLDGLLRELDSYRKTELVVQAVANQTKDRIGGGGLDGLKLHMKLERSITAWEPLCFHFETSPALQGSAFWQMLAQRGRSYSEVLAFFVAMNMATEASVLRDYLSK